MLLRLFVLRAQDGKPGQGLIDPTESDGPLQNGPSCLAPGHPQPIGAEGTRAVHGSLGHSTGMGYGLGIRAALCWCVLAVRPHSISQTVHICPSLSSLRNFIRADR